MEKEKAGGYEQNGPGRLLPVPPTAAIAGMPPFDPFVRGRLAVVAWRRGSPSPSSSAAPLSPSRSVSLSRISFLPNPTKP